MNVVNEIVKFSNIGQSFHEWPNDPYGVLSSKFAYHSDSFCRGIAMLGGKPGEWFKTSIIANALKKLLFPFGLETVIVEHGFVLRRELDEALKSGFPVLLLFPLMLGMKKFDQK